MKTTVMDTRSTVARRLAGALLVAVLGVGLAACSPGSKTDDDASPSASATATDDADATDEMTDDATDDDADATDEMTDDATDDDADATDEMTDDATDDDAEDVKPSAVGGATEFCDVLEAIGSVGDEFDDPTPAQMLSAIKGVAELMETTTPPAAISADWGTFKKAVDDLVPALETVVADPTNADAQATVGRIIGTEEASSASRAISDYESTNCG